MALNILWITTDHQQWRTIAGRSACRTPNINRLVDEGMLFNRAYTPMPVCCPVRAMWMSGAFPWHNGVHTQVHSAPSLTRDMYPDDLALPRPRLLENGTVEGVIINVDPFGNLISNITAGDLERAGLGIRGQVLVAGTVIPDLKEHYAQGETGRPLALLNSSGHVEIAVRGGRAIDVVGAGKGETIRVEKNKEDPDGERPRRVSVDQP